MVRYPNRFTALPQVLFRQSADVASSAGIIIKIRAFLISACEAGAALWGFPVKLGFSGGRFQQIHRLYYRLIFLQV